jgi:hypothetical protein
VVLFKARDVVLSPGIETALAELWSTNPGGRIIGPQAHIDGVAHQHPHRRQQVERRPGATGFAIEQLDHMLAFAVP